MRENQGTLYRSFGFSLAGSARFSRSFYFGGISPPQFSVFSEKYVPSSVVEHLIRFLICFLVDSYKNRESTELQVSLLRQPQSFSSISLHGYTGLWDRLPTLCIMLPLLPSLGLYRSGAFITPHTISQSTRLFLARSYLSHWSPFSCRSIRQLTSCIYRSILYRSSHPTKNRLAKQCHR